MLNPLTHHNLEILIVSGFNVFSDHSLLIGLYDLHCRPCMLGRQKKILTRFSSAIVAEYMREKVKLASNFEIGISR